MTRLLRATSLIGRPVVTLDGESSLEIKDIVFDRSAGDILGFTLRKHGFLGSPVKEQLSWSDVHGLGPDAVIVPSDDVFSTESSLAESGGDVIGDRVITENGTDLGEVIEVIISSGRSADVVGFEIEPAEGLQDGDGHNVFIPLPDTVALSGDNVIVPDSAKAYIRDDLSGFGGAVSDFRSQLGRSN